MNDNNLRAALIKNTDKKDFSTDYSAMIEMRRQRMRQAASADNFDHFFFMLDPLSTVLSDQEEPLKPIESMFSQKVASNVVALNKLRRRMAS